MNKYGTIEKKYKNPTKLYQRLVNQGVHPKDAAKIAGGQRNLFRTNPQSARNIVNDARRLQRTGEPGVEERITATILSRQANLPDKAFVSAPKPKTSRRASTSGKTKTQKPQSPRMYLAMFRDKQSRPSWSNPVTFRTRRNIASGVLAAKAIEMLMNHPLNKSMKKRGTVQKNSPRTRTYQNVRAGVTASQDDAFGMSGLPLYRGLSAEGVNRFAARTANAIGRMTPAERKTLKQHINQYQQNPFVVDAKRQFRADNRPPLQEIGGRYARMFAEKTSDPYDIEFRQIKQRLNEQQRSRTQYNYDQEFKNIQRRLNAGPYQAPATPFEQEFQDIKNRMTLQQQLSRPTPAQIQKQRAIQRKWLLYGLTAANIGAYGLIGQKLLNQRNP